MTAITYEKLRDIYIEIFKQITHEKKNKKNTIPEALIPTKEKHARTEKPIQKMERFGHDQKLDRREKDKADFALYAKVCQRK